jgi:hypothetical protein
MLPDSCRVRGTLNIPAIRGERRSEKKMQRKKILIAGLAIVLLVGIAFAMVLQYYGRITETAKVGQAVLVDGKDITGMPITYTFNAKGGETIETTHYITDVSSQSALVKIVSYGISAPYNDWAGVTVTYGFTLTTTAGTSPGQEVDMVSMPVSILWKDFVSVSYTYKIRSGSDHKWAPFVVLGVDTDGDGEDETMMSTPQVEAAGYDTWYTKTWSKEDFFVVYGSTPGEDAKVLVVAIDAGWQGTPQTNPGAQVTDVKDIYINNAFVSKSGIVVKVAAASIPNSSTLHFSIFYSFALDIYPGDYVITTDVLPAGPTEVTYYP